MPQSTHPLQPQPQPTAFTKKKSTILAALSSVSTPSYSDKSPKGSVDAEIVDLIDEINAFEGYVTTSSCAGRVAVFVEGRKGGVATGAEENEDGEGGAGVGAGPGGKGFGNKWLFVSHEPVPGLVTGEAEENGEGTNGHQESNSYHDLFNLTPPSPNHTTPQQSPSTLRLIKLTFSPLILHILCSSLSAARPLLASAINSGFRESGVQSLKETEGGVMVAIRTAGCAFETVIGYVEEGEDGKEMYRSVVGEGWLKVCFGVVNGRFEENAGRRERLRGGLRGIKERSEDREGEGEEWEDKEVRRVRKREEGLRIKREKEKEKVRADDQEGSCIVNGGKERTDDIEDNTLSGGLLFNST